MPGLLLPVPVPADAALVAIPADAAPHVDADVVAAAPDHEVIPQQDGQGAEGDNAGNRFVNMNGPNAGDPPAVADIVVADDDALMDPPPPPYAPRQNWNFQQINDQPAPGV